MTQKSRQAMPRGLIAELATCFAAGLLLVSPALLPSIWPLSFVGLALFAAAQEAPAGPARRVARGYAASLAAMTVVFYWLTFTMVAYGHVPLAGAVIVFLLYVAVFGTKLPFLALLLDALQRRSRLSPYLALPLAATTVEIVHLSLFPWYLGTTQVRNLYLLQIADVTGMAGVTFSMAVVAALLRDAMFLRRRPRMIEVAGVAATLVVVYGYGWVRLAQVEVAEAGARPVRVLLVQPDSPLRMERDVPTIRRVVSTCRRLTIEGARAAGGPLDLVVWPEGATPFFYGHREWPGHREFTDAVQGLSRGLRTNFMFNDTRIEGDDFYNNVWLLDRTATQRGSYQKVMLLAFGEYMPLSDRIPALRGFAGVSNFRHGREIRVLETDAGTIAPQVCYEIVYPDFTRRFVGLGADFIVNGTNDAWFGPTTASLCHLNDALPRAIENRVPLVRCANSGISTVISAGGRLLVDPTPEFEPAFRVAEIRPPGIRTFYTRHGDVFGWACVALTALLVGWGLLRPGPASDGEGRRSTSAGSGAAT